MSKPRLDDTYIAYMDRHWLVQVKYMTRGATWSPSYDLRVDTMTDSVSCTYYGMVTQSTTEDWKGAVLCVVIEIVNLEA